MKIIQKAPKQLFEHVNFQKFSGGASPRTPLELFLFLNQLQISSVVKKTLKKVWKLRSPSPFTISRYATAGPGCRWKKSGHWFCPPSPPPHFRNASAIAALTCPTRIPTNFILHYTLNVLKTHDRINMELAKFMYKFSYQMLPEHFCYYFTKLNSVHQYNTTTLDKNTRMSFIKLRFDRTGKKKLFIISHLFKSGVGNRQSLAGHIDRIIFSAGHIYF